MPVHTDPTLDPNQARTNGRGVTILARSLFRQMREQGYSSDQIVGLSSELIDLVSQDLRGRELEAAE